MRTAFALEYFSFGVCLFPGLPAFLTADSIYINFIGYEMPHWCEIPELRNLSFDIQVSCDLLIFKCL